MAHIQQAMPENHTALVFHSINEPLKVTEQPAPRAGPGSAVIRVVATAVMSYTNEVLSGLRAYPYPTPFTPGNNAVGYITSLGLDSTTLTVGDLVFADIFLRGRDDPNALALRGVHQGGSEQSLRLVQEEFRNGTYAEYAKVPLENISKLPKESKYTPEQWLYHGRAVVPFGGLTDDGGLDLRPGETIAVAPATGQFGGAAVDVALAMGGRVVALGRSSEGLSRLEQMFPEHVEGRRLRTVRITGDVKADTSAIGPVDCYFDISPPAAAENPHIMSCFLALKSRGRVCLMGGIRQDILIPHGHIYRNNISIKGKWMYEQNAPGKLAQMVEADLLRLDRQVIKAFPLEQWKEAFDDAAERMRPNEMTIIKP